MPKNASKKFTAKHRKELVKTVISQEDGIVENSVSKLYDDVQFKYCTKRRDFIELFKDLPLRANLHACAKNMRDLYHKLLKKFCTGKKYLELQQAWFMHINLYFDDSCTVPGLAAPDAVVLSSGWNTLIQNANEANVVISQDDQRIILSTLAYIISDLMSDKIKQSKRTEIEQSKHVEFDHFTGLGSSNCNSVEDLDHETFSEGIVSIYRYAGSAIHSMISKRMKSSKVDELEILEIMRCCDFSIAPRQIQQLNEGNMCMMNPVLTPFVKLLLDKINLYINRQQLKVQGSKMVEIAKSCIVSNEELITTFIAILDKAISDKPINRQYLDNIWLEFSTKIFHSKVNEFFKAQQELSLESEHKIVVADQSLRDTLKTLSVMKHRV